MAVIEQFHPAVAAWFREVHEAPTECQRRAWEALRDRHHVLISAPTGSGKTLAAFLSVIDELAREGDPFGLPDETRVLYVSPLKALSNDVQKNLSIPLDGINRKLFENGAAPFALRSELRTGDTPAIIRAAMLRHPPHILVTTPESLYILLTGTGGRRLLKTVRTVIVDEIHAVIGSKRGAHLALSLERLARLTGQPLTRIGLSATQNPIDEVARFLGPTGSPCAIIDEERRRAPDLAIELPELPLGSVLSQEAAGQIHDRLAELIEQHRTTLVFVNTRRLAERVARALTERLGEGRVTSHHGSLSREQRLSAEDRLKQGTLSALVATGSLELGIDVGAVDLVCHIGSSGSIAALIQRVGRSGHTIFGTPKGRLFPTTRDDLVECVALIQAVRMGELDRLRTLAKPLDVLAQQIVAMVCAEEWSDDDLYECVKCAYPYRELTRQEFDAVVNMLADGYGSGARAAHIHRDGIRGRLLPRRSARLTAVTCGGAIPDNAEYPVVLDPGDEVLGAVDEHFAIETVRGDVFQLGNASWRVLGTEAGALRVADADGQLPTIPFWFGEAPGRTDALSDAISRLRRTIESKLAGDGIGGVTSWLATEPGVPVSAAEQVGAYLAAAWSVLGVLPTCACIVAERFFDASGGMQLVIHAPFGSRLNRAWGLALRKRFCRTFNFELQAAANENALILSLGASQSFSLDEVRAFLKPSTVRDVLVQALLDAPMFTVRWRWNAVSSLAIKRFQAGRKTPPHLLRMQAEDLVTRLFPDQLACLENIAGARDIPDHPLVRQTIHDCLTGAMDIDGLAQVLDGIAKGTLRFECRDVSEPSALAAEIVNARAYSFLDGAPLEERRTRAVAIRPWLDPVMGTGTGAPFDPEVIEQVRSELRPAARTLEELHDQLFSSGFLIDPGEIDSRGRRLLHELVSHGRVIEVPSAQGAGLWFAAERQEQLHAIYPSAARPLNRPALPFERALVDLLRARVGIHGPFTEQEIASTLDLPRSAIAAALAGLQQEGLLVCGRFTIGSDETEWCERSTLARIQRRAARRVPREHGPVSSADFWRFLVRWQHVHPESKMRGPEALTTLLGQLEGWEAPAAAWESELLAARMENYDPLWLDQLSQTGRCRWLRLSAREGAGSGAIRTTPIALINRIHLRHWRPEGAIQPDATLSDDARRVFGALEACGALFLDELSARAGLTLALAEAALAELVTCGLVSSDGFAGLRGLLVPERDKRRFKGLDWGLESAGRWSLFASPAAHEERLDPDGRFVHVVRTLFLRYGILFRSLCARERAVPPWPDLLPVLRRLAVQGEIRTGRFVSSPDGEQFALPDAITSLRALRPANDEAEIMVSASDPLNLTGILFATDRVPHDLGTWLVFRRGVPVATSDRSGQRENLCLLAASGRF